MNTTTFLYSKYWYIAIRTVIGNFLSYNETTIVIEKKKKTQVKLQRGVIWDNKHEVRYKDASCLLYIPDFPLPFSMSHLILVLPALWSDSSPAVAHSKARIPLWAQPEAHGNSENRAEHVMCPFYITATLKITLSAHPQSTSQTF